MLNLTFLMNTGFRLKTRLNKAISNALLVDDLSNAPEYQKSFLIQKQNSQLIENKTIAFINLISGSSSTKRKLLIIIEKQIFYGILHKIF